MGEGYRRAGYLFKVSVEAQVEDDFFGSREGVAVSKDFDFLTAVVGHVKPRRVEVSE